MTLWKLQRTEISSMICCFASFEYSQNANSQQGKNQTGGENNHTHPKKKYKIYADILKL
jgi:hypothetical protein